MQAVRSKRLCLKGGKDEIAFGVNSSRKQFRFQDIPLFQGIFDGFVHVE